MDTPTWFGFHFKLEGNSSFFEITEEGERIIDQVVAVLSPARRRREEEAEEEGE